jgi:hypothetical protein
VFNCTFVNNEADDGGSIALDAADNTIIANSTFINNRASHGAGIGVYSKNVQILNSVFRNNSGETAAAVSIYGTQDLSIVNSNFSANRVTGHGGAIRIGNARDIIIQGSVFDNNVAVAGGAI